MNLLERLGIRRGKIGPEELTATGRLAVGDFLVQNLVCQGCADRIAGALASLPGVRDVTSKVPQKRIQVRYDPGKVREQQIKDVLATIGFEALDAGENA